MRTYIRDIKIGENVKISGFIDKMRVQKTMIFAILRDNTGKIQVVIDRAGMPDINEKVESLLRDSVLTFEGVAVSAPNVKLGGVEFIPDSVIVESIAEDLPIDDDSSQDLRLDYRWIDLREEKKRLIFEVRTCVEHYMRQYLIERNYIELHTPKISGQSSEGGAEVFGLEYYGQKAYLTQSPQFYKQMAIASGFDKVFEFGAYYRAEKSFTARHSAESNCVDIEVSNIDSHHEIMDIIEDWMAYVMKNVSEKYGDKISSMYGTQITVPNKIPRLTLAEVFDILVNKLGMDIKESKMLDLDPEGEKAICEYASEHMGSDFVFVTDYPTEARAFYTKRHAGNPLSSMSIDLLYRGWEISSGAVRENRYDVLKSQIEDKGIDSVKMASYLDFFRYGCPTHGGIGMGVDRLIAKMLGLPTIKESIFVFRGPNRLTP